MANNESPAVEPKALPASLRRGGKAVAFGIGSVFFRQGDPADTVFCIDSGRVKLAVMSAQGKEAVVGLFRAGDFFGESCLIGQPLRMATATAMTDCQLVHIERAQMTRILKEEPSSGAFFVRHLLTRNSRVEEDLVDQLFNSSEKRLARTLLLLANVGKEGGLQPITTPVSQETLAEIVGTTRSRVSHFMNKFRKQGFIDYDGRHLSVRSSLMSVLPPQ
jgi:CRP-like cAMP-binding protein